MTNPGLPSNVAQIFVAGTFRNFQGNALAQRLVLSPSLTVTINAGAEEVTLASEFSAMPDSMTGFVSIPVVATDDPDLNPTNFTYTVTEPSGRKYPLAVSQDTPVFTRAGHPLSGQRVVWLHDAVPAPGPSSGVVQIVAGPQGPMGEVSAAQLSAAVAAAKLADRPDLNSTGAAVGTPSALVKASDGTFSFTPAGLLPGAATTTRVLVVGSSNAEGAGSASPATSWVGRLAAALSTHAFFNEAVAGISPSFWVTPDGTGRSPLEQHIISKRPHIAIVAFTAQNGGGPSATFLGWMERAQNICERYGVRMIGITPYASNDYTATQRDANQWLVSTLKRRGVPLLNFSAIWGTGATIPASLDTGDGLHINDAGHLEQFRQVPLDYLSLDCQAPRELRLPDVDAGLTVPAGLSGAFAASSNNFPVGSWTVGVRIKLPASDVWGVGALGFLGNNNATRVRFPAGNQLDVNGGLVHPAVTGLTTASEHHVALSWNAVTEVSNLYIDGALASTATATALPGRTFTGLVLGSTAAQGSYATGYRFRQLTIHATELQAHDVARLAKGVVAPASLSFAAILDDATGRPASARLAAVYGNTPALTTGTALA